MSQFPKQNIYIGRLDQEKETNDIQDIRNAFSAKRSTQRKRNNILHDKNLEKASAGILVAYKVVCKPKLLRNEEAHIFVKGKLHEEDNNNKLL